MIGLQNIRIYKSCSERDRERESHFKDSPPSFIYSNQKAKSEASPPFFFHLVAQMNSYTKILEETRSMVSSYMSGLDPSHDMYHVDRVTNLGMCVVSNRGF